MNTLELVSWNLNGLEAAAAGPRAEAALQDVLLGARVEAIAAGAQPRNPPDVVLLQEVVASTFHAALKPHLRAAGFALHPASPPDRSYFEVCAVRPPWTVLEYRSEPLWKTQYGRWQHELDIEAGGVRWRVLTAHLDSGPESATSAIREAQVRDLAGQLTGPRAVFAGDTNLRDPEWDRASRDLDIVDAWSAAGALPETRFTWSGHQRRARFDRAWVSPDLEVTRFELLGQTPVAAGRGQPPSDHLGLRVALRAPEAVR